ncbi:MAG: hypothetical protein ACI8P3_000806 [Saprospiraceae bacterium]|jgi:hypothetical protein
MTKLLPAVLITLLITGMSIFSVYQSKTITVKDVVINEQVKEISFLEVSLSSEEEANAILLADNMVLRANNDMFLDSIFTLNSKIKKLQVTIQNKNKVIKSITAKLKDIENEYNSIKMEIAELVRKDQIDKSLISNLEADKAVLRQEISSLAVQKEQEIVSRQETEAELLDRQISEARFKRITDLVNNTKVKFNKITLSKERFGKAITKIKKENSKWKYTVVEFFLEHQDLKLLLDEQFIVKIVNTNNGEILSYIESNPNFPDSEIDSKGVEFKFDGNMLEISYFNNQEKNADNYEVQVFYLSDGEEYLLLNGTKRFIKDRKVLKP